MRAIIIQDSDASNLLDLLKLETFKDVTCYDVPALEAWQRLPPHAQTIMIERIHAKFRYVVCRWLQEQGASVVR